MKEHPLINTLLNLRGNPRACVYTEPLWGIPYNLFAPYASLFMFTLGVNDSEIGLIASIGMVFQIIFALLGGVITDKLGRRWTTLIFDTIAWSVPCFIWAISQNFTYFLVAAIFNSVAKVTMNSWACLLVEDADKEQIVKIYTWIYIAGLGAAFFAPLTGVFIGIYSFVPTIRVIYFISFILMTSKFVILFFTSKETGQGSIRIEETKHLHIGALFLGYGPVLKQLLKTKETMFTLGLMLIMSITTMISMTFWPLIVTQRLNIPAEAIGLFPFVKSAVMLVFFFILSPKIGAYKFRRPLLTGFIMFVISQMLLVIIPERGYALLVLSIILEASALSIINPLIDSLQVVLVDEKERARIIALLSVIVIGVTSPFGFIAGVLSSMDKRLPFILSIILLICGLMLTYGASKHEK